MSFFGSALDSVIGGLRDDDRNARAAADQRQAEERGAERQMVFQRDEASTARQFAERMSNSAHQREIQDLRAAGLNPVLSATGGSGSSTPVVSAPSGSKAGAALQTATTTGMGAVTTAAHLRRNAQEIQNMKASEELTKAQTKTEGWREKTELENIYRTFWEAMQAEHGAKNKITEGEILKHDEKGRRLEGQIDDSRYGEIMRYINRALGATNSATGIRNMFRQR